MYSGMESMSEGTSGNSPPKHDGAALLMQRFGDPRDELAEQFAYTAQFLRGRLFLAPWVVGHADVVGFIRRKVDVLPAAVRINQVLKV
jgi:hypothetical protein